MEPAVSPPVWNLFCSASVVRCVFPPMWICVFPPMWRCSSPRYGGFFSPRCGGFFPRRYEGVFPPGVEVCCGGAIASSTVYQVYRTGYYRPTVRCKGSTPWRDRRSPRYDPHLSGQTDSIFLICKIYSSCCRLFLKPHTWYSAPFKTWLLLYYCMQILCDVSKRQVGT